MLPMATPIRTSFETRAVVLDEAGRYCEEELVTVELTNVNISADLRCIFVRLVSRGKDHVRRERGESARGAGLRSKAARWWNGGSGRRDDRAAESEIVDSAGFLCVHCVHRVTSG